MKYDIVIIGAGMAGLGAGIRLAHYGKKVCILEKHTISGGLNSHYAKDGHRFDVGLHAMTNFAHKSTKRAPLNKILRQLRIPYDNLDLVEQSYSQITFSTQKLQFSNNSEFFEQEITEKFPYCIDDYLKLKEYIINYDDTSLKKQYNSARDTVQTFIKDPLLIDMLFCPLMYYGSAVEKDMDFSQFCIMFKSIFLEGFCRPQIGVRHLLRLLKKRYKESGGEIRFNAAIKKILTKNTQAYAVELENGQVITANKFFSSAGLVETSKLLERQPKVHYPAGNLSFVETILLVKNIPTPKETINFFNNATSFNYCRPHNQLVNYDSGVICYPNNFKFTDKPLQDNIIRITNLANYDSWEKLTPEQYQEEKHNFVNQQIKLLKKFNNCSLDLEYNDAFTPLTIQRFTWHKNGAIYGSPKKVKDGLIGYDNLYIIGTDQGFLGIIGALLSGISIANLYGLQ